MTKLRTCGSLTFAQEPSRKESSLGKFSLPAMICIIVLFVAAVVIASPAQNVVFTTLWSFSAGGDGANPGYESLIRGTDGNFYGTTSLGGNLGCNNGAGCGTVFKMTPSGTLTTLYSFQGQSDGAFPEAGLLQATDGSLYGTTSWGGLNGSAYYGTVFKITPAGTLTTLYSFCSQHFCTDGRTPMAPLVHGADGNFYGTTTAGGTGCDGWGCGTFFKITPAGALTTLYSFCTQPNCSDGNDPSGTLVQIANGDFYGTTSLNGTVFKVTPNGVLTTLYSFCAQPPNCPDGYYPYSGLVQASDGNFYGTTSSGGANGGGTVFRITSTGALTTLHNFEGYPMDGFQPYAGLVQASDGNFYGTTYNGGAGNNCNNGCGTVFKMTPSGTLTTLHSFDGTDGTLPYGGLVQAPDGFFYGTTNAGGSYGYGTVFRVGVARSCATCRR